MKRGVVEMREVTGQRGSPALRPPLAGLYAPSTYLVLYVPVVILKLLIQYENQAQGLLTRVYGRGILRSLLRC